MSFLCPLTQASELPREDIKKAVSLVLGSDQPLTRNEYELFWSYLKGFSEEEKSSFISMVREQQGDLFDFNIYIWECADVAWLKQATQECPKADRVWDRIEENFARKYGVSPERTADVYDNSRRILNAAAQRHSYKSVGGEVYDLGNRIVILETIFSFEGRKKRLDKALERTFLE